MRTDVVTLDASCVAKLLLEEDNSPAFRAWYFEMRAALGVEFQSPTLLQWELGNIVHREFADLQPEERGELVAHALSGIDLVPVEPAAPFKVKGALTYYDASYVAAAQETGALATDDGRMAKACTGQGSLVQVWTAGRRGAALDKRFVAWLARHEDGPAADLAANLRDDPSAIHLQTFLEVWRHLELIAAPQRALEALDAAFEAFAQDPEGRMAAPSLSTSKTRI